VSDLKTIREIRELSYLWLTRRGVNEARLDVDLLLASALGCDRLTLFLDIDRPLREQDLTAFRDMLRRRGRREPLQYILGEREFYSLAFEVNPSVLIPRPESEMLVEMALTALAEASSPRRWADIGTGSGCLAVAVAHGAAPEHHGWATDLSPDALAVATRNAGRHGVTTRLSFAHGDLFEPLTGRGPFDLILSNPPYIASAERAALEPEVVDHEPHLALFDPRGHGLGLIERLVTDARSMLAPAGLVALEFGAGQGPAAVALMERLGYEGVQVKKDFAGHDRVLSGRWTGELP
jgi:release factor glutamine methyltransferase